MRATDDKRDRILRMYFTIVLAANSGLILMRLNPNSKSPDVVALSLILLLSLFLLGEVVTLATISSRKWHAEYMNCFIMLQAMVTSTNYLPSSQLVPDTSRHPYIGNFFTSWSFVLVQNGLLITILLTANVLVENFGGNNVYLFGAVTALLVIASNALVSQRLLARSERTFWANPTSSWCLSCLNFPEKQRSSKK